MSTDNKAPIVFVNNPISSMEEDVVGLGTSVNTIIEAIDNDANMIGVVADYGTGKSSVTELLSNKVTSKQRKYPTPIKINMWDCLQKQEKQTGEDEEIVDDMISNEISDLTKSFLFQLANGKSRKLASYINKRLSNNYSLLSFSLGSKWSWFFFILAIIAYAIGKVSSLDNIYVPTFITGIYKEIGKLLYDLSPVFIGVALIFAAIGLSFSSIAFSHWKMEKKSKNEVNDIFDAYEFVINKLRPKWNKIKSKLPYFIKKSGLKKTVTKKQIIVIEDLDRISDKSVIIGFLKELYRFQTSLENVKNEFTFIVSIKPEAMLKEVTGKKFEFDDKKIYSKIFDVTILLKPIHYDDYDSILIQLLKSNPDKKKALEDLIGCGEINDTLPPAFQWIKKGTNLTIRELKDRLNSAIAIYVSLLNKKHKGNPAAKFDACAAVSYLEHQYPKDYSELILAEESLSNLINESYKIQNENPSYSPDELEKAFTNIYKKEDNSFDYNSTFVNELCHAIDDGLFDKDFRMYFYTYPIYSHIKTTEEKYLCDVLQLQHHSIEQEVLDASVTSVYEKTDDNVVTETLKSLNQFPVAVLLNDKLLELAASMNSLAVFEAIDKYVFNANKNRVRGISILERVHRLDGNQEIINHINDSLPDEESTDKIYYSRLLLCESFKDDVVCFKELFMSGYLITEDEISVIANPNTYIQLIDSEILSPTSFEYVSESLVKQEVNNNEAFSNALSVFNKYIELVSSEQITPTLFSFMELNHYITPQFFDIITEEIETKSIDRDRIARFLNSLDIADISTKPILYTIDGLGLNQIININIVKELIANGYYFTPLLYCENNNCLEMIDFDENIESITEELQYVSESDISENCNNIAFYNIRQHIISQQLPEDYTPLFFGEFPLITKDEYLQISNYCNGIELINTGIITANNSDVLCDIINSKKYNKEEIVFLFSYLFDPDTNGECIEDENLIKSIIDNLDYSHSIDINLLNETERDELVEPIYDSLGLANSDTSLEFMRKTKCLIPMLEEVLQKDEDYRDEYIELLNELDQYTEKTITWITEELVPGHPLPISICNALYDREAYYDYIPAASLRSNELIVDERINFNEYIYVYQKVPEMFKLMSNNTWFLEHLRDSKQYSELTVDQLRPLYRIEQIEPLFRYVFENYDDSEKMHYLNFYTKFKTEEDSKAFQLMICKSDNLELIGDQNLYFKIRESLWESNPTHKGQFTKLWNQRWKEE